MMSENSNQRRLGEDSSAPEPFIRCRGLQKWYSGVFALKGVDLDVFPSEIVGLVGDNGAGKSTLIQILSGAHQPSAGEIYVDGSQVRIRSTRHAMRLGIETIYQNTAIVPSMSIARNIFIGREPLRFSIRGIGILNEARMRTDAVKALRDFELELRSPDALAGELSGGQRQGVTIARAMYFKSRLLILDEPTNHLSVKETDKLLEAVSALRSQNVTAIFISHNIHHVYPISDRIVVMSRGEKIADLRKEDTSIDEIHELLSA